MDQDQSGQQIGLGKGANSLWRQPGEWSFGMIPRALGQQAFEQVRDRARARSLQAVNRDEGSTAGKKT
jgi:hypothetical protein